MKATDKLTWCIKFLFIFSIFFGADGCITDKPIKENHIGHLVVIGEDQSQTFRNFTPLTVSDLHEICNLFIKSKNGGKIILIGIGSTTPKGHVSCLFKPLVTTDKNKPANQQLKDKANNDAILRKNQEAVDQFLEKAETLLAQRNQAFTDINGFLEKASYVIDAPGFENYTKWLYVNTDGKQDTQKSKKVDCSLLPQVDNFCVSGWKSEPNCKPTSKFLAPSDFIEYLKSQL